MSTIVVVRKAERAVIAADTMFTSGSTKIIARYTKEVSKILRCSDTYVGLAGSSAHLNVFASIIRRHGKRLSFAGTQDIFETCLRLHPILKEEYFINTSEGEHDEYESSQITALVANPQGIFKIDSWREVFEYERFWAIGSGREYALGAMYTAYDKLSTPEEIAGLGVNAGCEFDDSSGLPLALHSVEITRSRNKRAQEPRPKKSGPIAARR